MVALEPVGQLVAGDSAGTEVVNNDAGLLENRERSV